MAPREAVIVDTLRTPIGKRKGQLAGWHPADLLGLALNELVERTGIDPERGRRRHRRLRDPGGRAVHQRDPQRVGRRPACPRTCSATTVDRQCGSSQQAMHFAAQGVIAGAYDLAIACGVESMSRVPMASNAVGWPRARSRQQYLDA